MIQFPAIGCRVLTPDLFEGVLEEVDQASGMAKIRHVAWTGKPANCSTWYDDVSVLRALPEGWVRPTRSPSQRGEPRALWEILSDVTPRDAEAGR